MEKFLDKNQLQRVLEDVKGHLDKKQETLTGQTGQVVGFGDDGKAVPQEPPVPLAAQVSYDVAESGLEAATVQGALDALSVRVSRVSNNNLLDNGYFVGCGSQLGGDTLPINQRLQTEYISNYGIDRWKCDGSTTVFHESVSFGDTFYQRVDDTRIKQILGKQVTISCMLSDGQVRWGTAILLATIPSDTTVYTLYNKDNFLMQIALSVPDGSPRTHHILRCTGGNFIAAKLELGPVQTLAHQDASGNWVLNDPPPNKALEVLKCQRFYERNVLDSTALRFTNPTEVYQTPIGFGFFVYFEVEKRVNPTVKLIYTIGDGALQETTINMVQKIGFTNSQIAVPPNQFIAVRGYEASSDL